MGPLSKSRRASIDQGFAKVAPQRDWMTEAEEKVEKEIRLAKQRATLARRCVGPRPPVVPPTASRRGAGDPPPSVRPGGWARRFRRTDSGCPCSVTANFAKVKNEKDRRCKNANEAGDPGGIWNRSNWNETRFLVVLALCWAAIGVLVWFIVDHPRPDRYVCTREPCEQVTIAGGQQYTKTYYTMSRRKHERLGLPSECWGRWNQTTTQWDVSEYQLRNETFSPAEVCEPAETLFYVLASIGANWILFFTAGCVALVNFLVAMVGFFAPKKLLGTVHLFSGLALWGALVVSAVFLSWWSIFWAFMAIGHLVYFFMTKGQIKTLDATLDQFFKVFVNQQGALFMTLTTTMTQCALFLGWGFMYVYINGRLTGWVDAVMFLILLWFSQIVTYTHFTVSSHILASWFFAVQDVKSPTLKMLKRTSTTSLGTIANGALFVGTSKFLKIIINYARSSAQGMVQVLGAFLTIVDRLLYMNSTYAFSYLAIYNDPFKKCAQNAYKKIAQSGLQAIPLDDVYTGASLAGTFAMAIFSTAVAWIVTTVWEPSRTDVDLTVPIFIPAFGVGLICGFSVLQTFEGAITTLCVCFAEDPDFLEMSNPEMYDELVELWMIYQGEGDSSEEEEDDGASESDVSAFSDEEEGAAKV